MVVGAMGSGLASGGGALLIPCSRYATADLPPPPPLPD